MNFSSFFGGGSSGLFNFNLGDYAAIRNGSYKRLMKSYYNPPKETTNTKSTTNDKTKVDQLSTADRTGLTKMKQKADDLKSAAETLSGKELWDKVSDGDRDALTSAVKDFVSSYNDMIDQAGKVSSSEIDSSMKWARSMTNAMSKSLSSVGITVGKDNKLTLNEDTLKAAGMGKLQSLFEGSYSYAGQIAQKASSVANAVTRTSGFYSNQGTWSNSWSSTYNQWI